MLYQNHEGKSLIQLIDEVRGQREDPVRAAMNRLRQQGARRHCRSCARAHVELGMYYK